MPWWYIVLIFRFLYFSTQSFKSGLLLFTVFVEGSVTSTPYILCVSPLCVYVSLHCVLCVLSVKVTMLLLRHTASMLQFPLLFAAVLKHLIWLQKTVASHGSADVKILNSIMATKQIIFFTCTQSKEQEQLSTLTCVIRGRVFYQLRSD